MTYHKNMQTQNCILLKPMSYLKGGVWKQTVQHIWFNEDLYVLLVTGYVDGLEPLNEFDVIL